MEHGQKEVQPSITLSRTWRKLPEYMSQRDTLQISYCNNQRMESQQEVQTPGGVETRIKENEATIQAIEEKLSQTEPTLIPSGSQGVDKRNFPVSSHHSGTRRSVAKSHHSSQSQVVSSRRQGYKGENNTSFRYSKKDSDPMIQKLFKLVKEGHKCQK
ncbi:hypothetical protein O181_024404 [Austropuccinia psidii MF-1]|uniref:Uncharacterized protein n=1 Tax=Austropuccinia psidii MF-1 TaxID=1389203 RepID=A0A9Q3GZM9_9BASI|nr:hypothetical protein [Austropuccinia psidii MF-1]